MKPLRELTYKLLPVRQICTQGFRLTAMCACLLVTLDTVNWEKMGSFHLKQHLTQTYESAVSGPEVNPLGSSFQFRQTASLPPALLLSLSL